MLFGVIQCGSHPALCDESDQIGIDTECMIDPLLSEDFGSTASGNTAEKIAESGDCQYQG